MLWTAIYSITYYTIAYYFRYFPIHQDNQNTKLTLQSKILHK